MAGALPLVSARARTTTENHPCDGGAPPAISGTMITCRFADRAALMTVVLLLAQCGDTASPQVARKCRVRIETGAEQEAVFLGDGTCGTRLAWNLRVATQSMDSERTPTWTDAAASPLLVGGTWTAKGNSATRTVRVSNTGSLPITLLGLEWGAQAMNLSADRMLHNGYQSWSYTGFQPILSAIPDAAGRASDDGGNNEDTLGERPGTSWWWTALSNAEGVGITAGASGGTVLKTRIAIDAPGAPRIRLIQGMTGDELVIGPGETKDLDGLYVGIGDVSTELDSYASYVASLHAPKRARKPALGGWGSWNMYYANISAADLRRESAWSASNLAPLGLTDFLLDDGYQTRWGSWQASPSFGADLATVNREQTDLGLRPAVWMAPFYVAVDDPQVAAHPDWFARRADGQLRTFNNYGPTYATLEVSSAGARNFVTRAVKSFWDVGYRSLKIDFLFGGALEATRTPAMTSLESYKAWLSVIHDAAPDMHLIGCGAPLLPSVGLVDSMRVGADIAFAPSPTPRYSAVIAQARQTILRAATDKFWHLDPDVLLLRGNGLSDVEAWTAVVSNALSGGNYMLGDGMQAGALRVKMATSASLLELTRDGAAARALDYAREADGRIYSSPFLFPEGGTVAPHLWQKRAADGKRAWLAVFAWESENYSARLALPAGAEELVPPTDDAIAPGVQPAARSRGVFEVPQHGVRLFRFDARAAEAQGAVWQAE